VETVTELRKRRIRTSRSSIWRFLDRHEIRLKKACKLPNGSERMWREHADVGSRARHACSTRLVSERSRSDAWLMICLGTERRHLYRHARPMRNKVASIREEGNKTPNSRTSNYFVADPATDGQISVGDLAEQPRIWPHLSTRFVREPHP